MTIREDVAEDTNENTSLSTGDAADAILKRWMPDGDKDLSDNAEGAKPAKKEAETPSEQGDDEEELIEEDGDQSETDQNEDDQDDEQETIAGDTAKVKITVDGKEVTASVKDLKRLYGQEAALTRKSQEVATLRKAAEDQSALHLTALQTLQKRAEEAYKPYAEADMLLLSKELTPEEFKAVREEAKKAHANYAFLTTELKNHVEKTQATALASMREKAQEARKTLEDPEKGIKGFNQDMYNELATFATAQGMDLQAFYNITDAPLIKLIHAAMRYDKAKKVTATKTAQAPKKVIKARQPTDAQGRFVKQDNAKSMQKLQQSGTRDDAVEALMSRWGVKE